jgi:hypothetical protein
MPANYTIKRRVGSIIRLSGAIVKFVQDGDRFARTVHAIDFSGTSGAGVAGLITLSVPIGIQVVALITLQMTHVAGGAYLMIYSPDNHPSPTSGSNYTMFTVANAYVSWWQEVRTSTFGQIYWWPTMANVTLYVRTTGWIDTRGRN